MGVLSPHDRSTTYRQELRDPAGLAGNVGIVSQSGAICISLLTDIRRFGFSHVVSSGNEAQQGEGFTSIVGGVISVTATDTSDHLLPAAQRLGSTIGMGTATVPGSALERDSSRLLGITSSRMSTAPASPPAGDRLGRSAPANLPVAFWHPADR